jgi:hypothetical protein
MHETSFVVDPTVEYAFFEQAEVERLCGDDFFSSRASWRRFFTTHAVQDDPYLRMTNACVLRA